MVVKVSRLNVSVDGRGGPARRWQHTLATPYGQCLKAGSVRLSCSAWSRGSLVSSTGSKSERQGEIEKKMCSWCSRQRSKTEEQVLSRKAGRW